MTAASFQVALTGLKEGHAAEDVAHHLARLFTQPPEKMLAILDGKRRVLKNGLSEADARKYEAALHGAGCTCAISSFAASSASSAAELGSPASPAPGSRDIVTATSTALAALATRAERRRSAQAQRAQSDLAAGQRLAIDSFILHGIYLVVQKHFGLVPSLLAWLLIVAVMIAALLRLCRGLGSSAPTRKLLIMSTLIPLAGLLILAFLTHQASKTPKE
ncbi:hypothetical protein ACHMW6_28570 [Pseudoduganella sp. UC29_106]|uniref:hypothetical protein n=1 Tax=Pseudoduganella sp. UC29_106 TaxID=3374553 RepID=UPI003756CDB2